MLFASALEGVGISTAFIQVNSKNMEFLLAFNLGIGQSAAESFFNGTNKILIIDDEVWMPLSMTAFNYGFISCWMQGATVLNKAFNAEEIVDFITVQDAWAAYPPAPLPELGMNKIKIDESAVLREFDRVFNRYLIQELNPLITRQSGISTAAGQNRLGILYVRAGRIEEGKAAYEKAAYLGSVPAMTNRGNLALIENDYTTAERWFRQALRQEPENSAAIKGIEKIQGSR